MFNVRNSFAAHISIFSISIVVFTLNRESNIEMPPKPKLNVQNFPRPPLIERTPRHLQVKWHGQIIADTKDAFWILETYHPPSTFSSSFLQIPANECKAYYLPPSSLKIPLLKTPKSTFCEWKGWATYYSITSPTSSAQSEVVKDRIWSYEEPNEKYNDLKGYLSFYAGPWECFVDGELVKPQPGDFYGGWTTEDIGGLIKGEGATRWL